VRRMGEIEELSAEFQGLTFCEGKSSVDDGIQINQARPFNPLTCRTAKGVRNSRSRAADVVLFINALFPAGQIPVAEAIGAGGSRCVGGVGTDSGGVVETALRSEDASQFPTSQQSAANPRSADQTISIREG